MTSFLSKGTNLVSSGTSVTSNFNTTAAGSNRLAVAVIFGDASTSPTITSVTLGGSAMTLAGTAVVAGNAINAMYYLVNPASGASTALAIVGTGTGIEWYRNLIIFGNVDQTTPVRASSYTSVSGNVSITVSSNASDLTISGCGCVSGNFPSATNQTSDGINSGGNDGAGSDHCTTAGASITHTWTTSNSGSTSVVGFSVQDVGGGGGGVTYPQLERGTRGLDRGIVGFYDRRPQISLEERRFRQEQDAERRDLMRRLRRAA